jgi:hypothetical protein
MAPILDNLHQQFGQDVVFVSVSGPLQGATVGDTAKFIGDYKSGLTYVFDSTGGVFNTYGVSGTPTFFIIGKNGTVTMTLQGEQTHDALANALTQASSWVGLFIRDFATMIEANAIATIVMANKNTSSSVAAVAPALLVVPPVVALLGNASVLWGKVLVGTVIEMDLVVDNPSLWKALTKMR